MWLEYLLFMKKLSVKARNKAVEEKSSRVLKEHFSAVKEVGVQELTQIDYHCHRYYMYYHP